MPPGRPLPPPTLARRLCACRSRIQQKSVDGYLVSSRADQFYLTGFDGEDGAVLILPRRVYLLTDGRFKVESAGVKWARAVVRSGGLTREIVRLVRRHRIGRLGFQPEIVSVAAHAELRRALRPARLVPVPQLVPELRLCKDETEVAGIRRAVQVAESAFRAVVRKVRIGMTERELAARLRDEMVRQGASDASFPIIVAEGPNAARPHATPGDRKLRVGSFVLVDWGAVVEHYCSDLTRMIFIRRIAPRIRRMYEHVWAAHSEAIRAIRPGARMCDVDAKARERLRRGRMDKQFSHGLGHGLGLDVHEPPRLSKHSQDPLRAGMVVTVEPGVYFPGVGGVRIEDDVLVTEDGCEVLSTLSRRLEDAVV